ncbi:MAG: hypothetical protein LBT78_01000 [Tannerella sp.]|jgi:hypothetical protein|nr:hypothetical protein [Tannerella sp.]
MDKTTSESGTLPVSIPCRGCAMLLVAGCYRKHWWFHVVRDPLVWGMKFLAWCNGIDARAQPVRKTYCKGCVRFIKNGLEEQSATFQFLNRFIGPWFGKLRNGMLTEEDMKKARQRAIEANN